MFNLSNDWTNILEPLTQDWPQPFAHGQAYIFGSKSLNRVKKSWRWQDPGKASYEVIEPVQITFIVILNLYLKMFPAKQSNLAK